MSSLPIPTSDKRHKYKQLLQFAPQLARQLTHTHTCPINYVFVICRRSVAKNCLQAAARAVLPLALSRAAERMTPAATIPPACHWTPQHPTAAPLKPSRRRQSSREKLSWLQATTRHSLGSTSGHHRRHYSAARPSPCEQSHPPQRRQRLRPSQPSPFSRKTLSL